MKESLEIEEQLEGRAYWIEGTTRGDGSLHRHDELELNLVVGGAAEYLIDGERVSMRQGTLLWLFPSQNHALSGSSEDFQMWVYVFRPGLLDRACKTDEFRELRRAEPLRRVFTQLSLAAFESLRDLCERAGRAFSENADLFNASIRYLLLSAWQETLGRDSESLRSEALHPGVFKAALSLCRDPAIRSLSGLARQVGMSSEHLSRLFKQQMGQALSDYRSEQRFRKFKELYGAGGSMNMLEASLAAGFGSYTQFYRIHVKMTGKAPSEGRRGN
ncbi:AraC family transcriptional regulator [Pelagicoccus sp. NFK12]|uniref:AraC family transcriptional regulator n=1 Tax=Pelagicoccus enzymogenes TaxID=2773457 RepID=A0A927F9N8_9BACT|nr:helix-turn-helix transcriptional regulator [Pelagicoccus enzymogenes]MBD5780415.1 AraC family transcriptional regulator [Pelagicoccus enzymogenes]